MNDFGKGLKIAMFGHKRIPSREGGVEIVVAELSTRMVALGHSVTCLNRSGHHVSGQKYGEKRADEYKGVQLKTVWTIDKKGLAAATSSFAAAFHTAFGKYDVVHIHAEGPAFMCWLLKLFGKRLVVTVHGLDWARHKWGKFASWYIRMGEKNAVRYADQIIVLSKEMQKYFLKTYNRDTVYIPNGVNKPEIKDAFEIEKRWGLHKGGYVLFLGRLVPEKGVHYLLEAWESIKIKTEKKLVITGGSSDTMEYIRTLKEKAGGDVLFTGFQQGRVLEELYSNAYVYVMPSDLEGMPLSLMEAMSYGNCCLVSDIEECTQVTGDHAIVFEKGNIRDLKEKLQYLLDHPDEVKRLRDTASEYVCEKFNWDDVVKRTLHVYCETGDACIRSQKNTEKSE